MKKIIIIFMCLNTFLFVFIIGKAISAEPITGIGGINIGDNLKDIKKKYKFSEWDARLLPELHYYTTLKLSKITKDYEKCGILLRKVQKDVGAFYLVFANKVIVRMIYLKHLPNAVTMSYMKKIFIEKYGVPDIDKTARSKDSIYLTYGKDFGRDFPIPPSYVSISTDYKGLQYGWGIYGYKRYYYIEMTMSLSEVQKHVDTSLKCLKKNLLP